MGQLDDAIREHLELKRSRGADPTEVAREEQEALGPVRRETEPPAQPTAVEADFEPVSSDDEQPADETDADPSEEATRLHRVQEEPEAPAVGARRLEPDEDFEWDPEERSSPADTAEAPEAEATGPEAEEDVLEETPEFLQETPEHDRLWFEQRPPRDFDWDK
ncbi:MAG: hypothetical protein ACR2K9_05485 [Solirubrobacteraceae bacterium]